MKPRRPRVVASAVVPLGELLRDVPPSVPYAKRDEVEGRLRSGGFSVFTLTHREISTLMAVAGIYGWLRERGYDPDSAEVVFFDLTAGWESRPAVVVGALRQTGRAR